MLCSIAATNVSKVNRLNMHVQHVWLIRVVIRPIAPSAYENHKKLCSSIADLEPPGQPATCKFSFIYSELDKARLRYVHCLEVNGL